MVQSTVLAPAADTIAGIYEALMAEPQSIQVTDQLLDGLFASLEAIDAMLDGQVGERARAVLGPIHEDAPSP